MARWATMQQEWPFRGAEAIAAHRVTAYQLRRFYTPVYPGVYAPRGSELTARQRAHAAWLWSRRTGVVAGLSAAAMLGAKWIEPGIPADLVHGNRRAPPMLTVHSDVLLPDETMRIAGMSVTTAARTGFDIGRRLPVTAGVQRLDALMNATRLRTSQIQAIGKHHRGVRGLTRLQATIALIDGGAESPYESLTRLVLVRAGLPKPETQIHVVDEWGHTVAYLDMGWRDRRVAVEYDGAQHWTDPRQRRRDIERLANVEALGWRVIRISSDMLRTPAVIVAKVRAALSSR